ncbi:hypothetical protein Bbelb_275390 [Branchiostoma belcheri]|nr:hypothetical protein Bbelb_275390 [Branchiostoma belcheri]
MRDLDSSTHLSSVLSTWCVWETGTLQSTYRQQTLIQGQRIQADSTVNLPAAVHLSCKTGTWLAGQFLFASGRLLANKRLSVRGRPLEPVYVRGCQQAAGKQTRAGGSVCVFAPDRAATGLPTVKTPPSGFSRLQNRKVATGARGRLKPGHQKPTVQRWLTLRNTNLAKNLSRPTIVRRVVQCSGGHIRIFGCVTGAYRRGYISGHGRSVINDTQECGGLRT